MKPLFLFFSILYIFYSYNMKPAATSTQHHNNFTDLESLLAFKAQVTDPEAFLSTNWTTNTSFCNWFGVSCSRRHKQRVTAISLNNMSLKGTISPYIANLTFLSHVNLINNSLIGPIPQALGYLPRLSNLHLSCNFLSGPIPSTILNMSSLVYFYVPYNNLSGSLPSNKTITSMLPNIQVLSLGPNNFTGEVLPRFAHCQHLQILSIAYTMFSGSIPTDIGGWWPMLIILYLDHNQFSGTIPTSLGNLTMLKQLDLDNNILTGVIPQELGNLPNLQLLDLSFNSLIGPIPQALGHLPRLSDLTLSCNFLSGPIPSTILNMSSLVSFYVAVNNLSGSLPSNKTITSMLPNIQFLSLDENNFTGEVLSRFAQCQHLQMLSILDTQFSGSIPTDIGGRWPKLNLLYLDHNQFSGTIPASVGNLTMLKELYLQNNGLTGVIPQELGNLPNLQVLDLSYNYLGSSIPTSLLNASMLNVLLLGANKLTGQVPSNIGMSLPLLNHLSVARNKLTGGLEFISSLSNCRNLRQLEPDTNNLAGEIPDSIGNLSRTLQYFSASENHIQGNLPVGLGNLTGLILLDLDENDLTGTIPSTVTRLQALQVIGLASNKISGTIPSELGLMTSLTKIYFPYNLISGPIPDSLANLSMLQYLDLCNNNLSSTIPQNLWTSGSLLAVVLSRNALYGTLPPLVANAKSLFFLDLSMNRLSGNIPSDFAELQMLQNLDLSSNSLHGQIPTSFARLVSLTDLNLSHNFLSGNIPNFLANLSYLESLDLSYNKLVGQIPKGGIFLNASIPVLIGNGALCGAPQLHFAPCPATNSSKKLKSLKYILPAIAASLVILACLCIIYAFYWRRKVKTVVDTNIQHLHDHRFVSRYELAHATNNFDEANLLGRGGFGSVFKGCLMDGLIVAVKVFNSEVEGASKSFDAECQVLRTVRHRNLIKIISVCSSLDFKAVVLQFMPNGNLEQWLYSENHYLNLLQRLNIMLDVSLALEYLHHHHPDVVLHCDLKPTNVLLDEEMVAHVGDFGIAKLLLGDSRSSASTSMPGTIGYIAPEYIWTGRASKMGDVYSFGILLLETFTGKRPSDGMFGEESSLREWVRKDYPSGVFEVLDSNLVKDNSSSEGSSQVLATVHQCLSDVIELGLLCSNHSPTERISMLEVVSRLRKIKLDYLSNI